MAKTKTKIKHEIPGLVKLATSDNHFVSLYAENGIFLILMPGEEVIISKSQKYAGIILRAGSRLVINDSLGTREFPVLYCNIADDAEILGSGKFHCAQNSGYDFAKGEVSACRVIKEAIPESINIWWSRNVAPVVDENSMLHPSHATLPIALLAIAGYDLAESERLRDTPYDATWCKPNCFGGELLGSLDSDEDCAGE